MRTHGTLSRWNVERGFGFISPAGGGPDVFVHISAFPRGGSVPRVGELLAFETQQTADGKTKAIRISRAGEGSPSRSTPRTPRRREVNVRQGLGPLAIVAVLGLGALVLFQRQSSPAVQDFKAPQPALSLASPPAPLQFKCDGRTHCSQMRSCEEATFFVQNCPNTEMDGNHDGTPCEQQWCN